MALPVILVNSGSGSDSLASGAGPTTAINSTTEGTTASTDGAGTLVTFSGATDLSGVLDNGSHVIYLADATAGARNFSKITAVNNGADTVTVADAFGVSLSGMSWAIGGKRASIGSTTSKKLFDNNSTSGDAMPGWIVEMQSGHTETITAQFDLRRGGDTTNGIIWLRGEAGAGTVPVVTFSNNGVGINKIAANHFLLSDFELRNSNATKTASVAFATSTNNQTLTVLRMKVSHSTNKFWRAYSTNQGGLILLSSEIGYCADIGIVHLNSASYEGLMSDCFIHDCGGDGVEWGSGIITLIGNVFYNNSGFGADINGTRSYAGTAFIPVGGSTHIIGNVFHANGGGGLELAGTGGHVGVIANNIFSNNTGYGISCAGTDVQNFSVGCSMRNNCFYSNTTAATNPSTLTNFNLGSITTDPAFTNAGSGNFAVGTNMKAFGWPQDNVGKFSGTRSYVDIGAAQRQESGGGSLIGPGARIRN